MKKNFTLLMMLIASFLFSTNVMAQFKYDITEEVKPDYATTNVEFSLAEVAAQLECSVEDLVAALDEWKVPVILRQLSLHSKIPTEQ